MQFAKLVNEDRYVNAAEFLKCGQKENIALVCPQCLQVVILKAGGQNKPHFSHLNQRQANFKSESDQHRNNKKYIFHELIKENIEANMEVRLTSGERRADILVSSNSQQAAAIELQYALINHHEIEQREIDYGGHQIFVVWLLGKSSQHYEFNRLHLQRLMPFLGFHQTLGFYLPYWDEQNKRVLLIQVDGFAQVKKQYILSIADYLAIYVTYNLQINNKILDLLLPDHKLVMTPIKDISHLRQIILKKPNKQEAALIDWLRRCRYSLWELPNSIHSYQQESLLYVEPLWIIMAYYVVIKHSQPNSDAKIIFEELASLITPRNNKNISQQLIINWLQISMNYVVMDKMIVASIL